MAGSVSEWRFAIVKQIGALCWSVEVPTLLTSLGCCDFPQIGDVIEFDDGARMPIWACCSVHGGLIYRIEVRPAGRNA